MSIILDGSLGITTPTYGGADTAEYITPVVGMKNRLINGSMMIDQRNAGASVTPANGAYTLDRWQVTLSQASKFSVQQNAGSVTPPAGFTSYAGITSLSSYSIVSGDYFTFRQSIEGFNFADMAWGTASASPVTLSFWVRSSLTGTFGGAFSNYAGNRTYPFSYTINAANTWEQKTVTISGDTSGTWVGASSSGSAILHFSIGTGSTYSGTSGAWTASQLFSVSGATSVVGTNGATFYITGVQLEKGSTATSFDYRPYGTELALCQRYYYLTQANAAGGYAGWVVTGATSARGTASFKVSMRATPTITLYDAGSNTSGTCTQTGIADLIAATAGSITSEGFSSIVRTSSTFNTSSIYPVIAGYAANAEL